ncbi:MAG TPA: hypothetical protein VGC39_00030 [Candidatus Methylacidiphilales bacterium]
MKTEINLWLQAGLIGLVLGLTACGTTGTATGTTAPAGSETAAVIEAALPLIRTGASVATGAVLDFAVKQSSTRQRLANEMYAAANAIYALSGGVFPAPAQFEAAVLAFGGTQTDANYAQFSTAIAGLYAAYYPKLVTGDTKTATDLLNALAGGIEDGTEAYVTTPAASAAPVSVTVEAVQKVRTSRLEVLLSRGGVARSSRSARAMLLARSLPQEQKSIRFVSPGLFKQPLSTASF